MKDFSKIKKQLTDRVIDFLDIKEKEHLDPIILLLLDVFAFEFATLEQEIRISDAKLLERISKILVHESWSSPKPAHSLVRIYPPNSEYQLESDDMFFYKKRIYGEENIDVIFTPLFQQDLVQTYISTTVSKTQIKLFESTRETTLELSPEIPEEIEEYCLWLGLDITEVKTKKKQIIDFTIQPQNADLLPYLKLTEAFDSQGNQLSFKLKNIQFKEQKDFYSEEIFRYYQNQLYQLEIDFTQKTSTAIQQFPQQIFEEDQEDFVKELVWIKLSFPAEFSRNDIEGISCFLNTFPVVNKKLETNVHQLNKNGKIISLPTDDHYFLNIDSLTDNNGKIYRNTLQNDISNLQGSYALYFGGLEQFDDRSAKAVLDHVIQTVRQEGSAFSAMGYDLVNAYLNDLNKKLDQIEQKIGLGFEAVDNKGGSQYLVSIPFKESNTLECNYWTTLAHRANGIPAFTTLEQYRQVGENPKIHTVAISSGGLYKTTAKEKINSLRYGLISKDRIVSKEDIKSFVQMFLGKIVEDVQVSSGVAISHEKKQGIIRVSKVEITLEKNNDFNDENKKRLAASIKKELEYRSVHNLPFHICIA
ncbi:MAG: hypothetical protein N4A45_13285 [Flavobacteriales bacterium]|jgi:hypothetical protein|nr:hypothetical protein [Flavobacteriales bacterium]